MKERLLLIVHILTMEKTSRSGVLAEWLYDLETSQDMAATD
jgi:hypothetical protein